MMGIAGLEKGQIWCWDGTPVALFLCVLAVQGSPSEDAHGIHKAAPQKWCLLFTLQGFEAIDVYLYLLFLLGGCLSLVIDALTAFG